MRARGLFAAAWDLNALNPLTSRSRRRRRRRRPPLPQRRCV